MVSAGGIEPKKVLDLQDGRRRQWVRMGTEKIEEKKTSRKKIGTKMESKQKSEKLALLKNE